MTIANMFNFYLRSERETVRVCVRERERERVCVCVRVGEIERKIYLLREREGRERDINNDNC